MIFAWLCCVTACRVAQPMNAPMNHHMIADPPLFQGRFNATKLPKKE